ncbi:MAG: Gfo/Idh/MocA family oxidoreductase [Victivallales bacterium]|nr:Gfo/Idh/MocA family oxidoreductase [Victivallales bacterium]
MTEKILKVAIIGLGHLHPVTYMPHFAACAKTQVVAASDQLAELRDDFTRQFGVKTYADWRELLEKEQIDLAYIFLPHCDMDAAAIACAERGIHVVVEKPVASTAAKAEAIAAACAKANVLFSTPYLWRFHPVTRKMKEVIDSGMLGRIVGCEGRCAAGGLHRYIDGHSEWMLDKNKSGGGPMYNLGVHWIDLYRWLLDSEITKVSGKNVRVNQQYNIEDNSFAIAEFASGATLALDISYTVPDSYPYGRDLYLAIRGTEGCINFAPSFEGFEQTMMICSNHPKFGGAPRQIIKFELEKVPGYCNSLGLEYVNTIADDILNGKKPFIGGDDAVRVLRVVEAIYEAAQTERTVAVKY